MSQFDNHDIQGNANVSRRLNVGTNARVNGSTFVGHDLFVGGWLEARNIKGYIKGLFQTVEKLREAYPDPEEGWCAFVGDSLPATLYTVIGGEWVSTGNTCGEPTIDCTRFTEELEELREELLGHVEGCSFEHDSFECRITQLTGMLEALAAVPRRWLVLSATRMTLSADGAFTPESITCAAMTQEAGCEPHLWNEAKIEVSEERDNGDLSGGPYTPGDDFTPDTATVTVTFRLLSPEDAVLDTATVAVVREPKGEAGTAFSVDGANVRLREGVASTAIVRITAVKGSQTLTLTTLSALRTDASGNAVYDLGGGLLWNYIGGNGYYFAYDGSGMPYAQSLQFTVTASDGSQFSGTIKVETVAAAYLLRPSASLVRRSGMTGACTPAKLKCEAAVSWGDMTAIPDGLAIRYKPVSQGAPLFVSALPESGVTVGDSWDSVDFELYRSASDFGTPLATVTVPVVTDGAQGIAGPAYRTSLWAADTDYLNQLNENVNPRTVDIAFIPDSSSQARYRAFLCKKSHRSSAANRPGTAGAPWEEFQGMPPVYTPLLLAENAVITLLQTNAIRVTGSSGGTAAGVAGGEWVFWGGTDGPLDAPYRVGADGSLYATKADIRGTVRATNGYFSGILRNTPVEVTPENIDEYLTEGFIEGVYEIDWEKLGSGIRFSGNFSVRNGGIPTLYMPDGFEYIGNTIRIENVSDSNVFISGSNHKGTPYDDKATPVSFTIAPGYGVFLQCAIMSSSLITAPVQSYRDNLGPYWVYRELYPIKS